VFFVVKKRVDHFRQIYSHRATDYHRLIAPEDADCNLARMLQRLIPHGKRILDLGTGTGRLPLLLAREAAQMVGLDLHWDMLRENKMQREAVIGKWGLIQGDMRELPFPTGWAEVVTAGWAIGHLRGWYADEWQAHIGRVLREMGRVAAPGGVIIIVALSIFVATVIDPAVSFLERWRIPRGLSVLIVYLFAMTILLYLFISLIPIIAVQIQQIVTVTAAEIDAFLQDPTVELPFLTPALNAAITGWAQQLVTEISTEGWLRTIEQFGERLSFAAQGSLVFAANVAGSVLNFVVNAEQAIVMSGRQPGRITIRTRDDEDRVILEVEDTGPGIDPEHEARLFQPFFTTKPVGQGTGLGLSVSYGIIDSLGGHIGYRSAPAGGAIFHFDLPAAA